MVFENLVGYLLDKYLGEYIENLDTKKLKIGLWSGNVVLENLYLKPNALANLNLPVKISVGYLQKLELQIPWKSLYTSPTKAIVDGLYLLVVPETEVEYDPKRAEKEAHEAKMREVQKVEELRKEKETAKDADKSSDTFAERMQLQVLRNLELSIQNIHIVYEDRTTKPEHPFAVGITLDYIKLQTTTPDWQPTILTEDTPTIHKLGDLSGFSIYWNTDAQSRSGMPRDVVMKNLQDRIATSSKKAPADMSYILRPLNVTARVVLVMKPGKDNYNRPMFDIKVDLDEISLNINRDQYLDILDLLEFQDHLTMKSRFIKYQIRDPKLKPSRKNWKFAYEAIVNEEVRPRFDCYKWVNIKAHTNRCREYRKIHLQTLLGKATEEEKTRAQELEKNLDVFNLTWIRRDAEIQAQKKKEQEPKTWMGTFSSWWGGAKPQDDPALDLSKVMTAEEKEKFYDAIGYEGEATSKSSYPKNYIDIDMNIRLKLLDVNVWSKINENDKENRIVIRANIPDTGLIFRRRPAADAIAVFVDLGSFQVLGIATNAKQSELLNTGRPILCQPVARSTGNDQQKLLHVEFETNPLDLPLDYRVKVVSQSLEIKYDAPTINKLQTCFEQDTQRNLQGVRQVAISTYNDVKNRSYILMKHNVEKIKRLDVDIDLQSSYFLLPQNGVYQEGGASICMDFGHFTLKRNTEIGEYGEERNSLDIPKDIEEARQRSYTQFKLVLEDVQLIFARQNESWENARKDKNTRLHLIKPMKLELDLGKCIYSDDAVLPAFKVAGAIPNIALRLSDKRLYHLANHIQSIPLPESKAAPIAASVAEIEPTQVNDPGATLEVVEGMTPVMKTKEKVEQKESDKENKSILQLTQLDAKFELKRVDLFIDQATSDDNVDLEFLHITLETIVVKTLVKTYEMQFNTSLSDLIVYHKQFVGKDNGGLRLISAEYIEQEGEETRNLVSMGLLHTSRENPLFLESPYNGIENNVDVKFSKLVVNLQLEALLSIFKFQDTVLKQLAKDSPDTQVKKKEEEEQQQQQQKATEENKKVVKKTDTPATPSLQITASLEEFQIILASKGARMFDIQVQGINANVSQARDKTVVKLSLSDLRVFDPYKDARYQKIISQKGDGKELLKVDLSLFTYPEKYEKPVDVYDCDVKVDFAKANIVFLYKHITALMDFLNSLNLIKAALDVASTQAESALEQAKKLQEQAFKVRLDITFRAPNIIVPANSFSDEVLFIDMGELTLKTTFYEHPVKSLVEKQTISLKNVLASRAKLDRDYNIIGEAVLLDCAELNTTIDRLLFPDKVKTEPAVSMNAEWDSIHFVLAKTDYTCVMKVLTENFSEKVTDQITEIDPSEQYHYKQIEQEKEEEQMRKAAEEVQKRKAAEEKQKATQGPPTPVLKFQATINKLALTLYLGESDLTVRRAVRNEKLQLANVQIEKLDARFSSYSDESYKAAARVRNFLLDDLRASNQSSSLTRMIDRHFTVDPNVDMLVALFVFTPKKDSNSAIRDLTAQLESLYICISLDYLMTLQDFFVSGLPAPEKPKVEQSMNNNLSVPQRIDRQSSTSTTKTISQPTKPAPTNVDGDLETKMKVSIKNPEVILLEDQHNPNSNCLVLDLYMETRIRIINNETHLKNSLTGLTVYSSNLAELKSSKDSGSKVKYCILQPASIDLIMNMTEQSQKIIIEISDIMVSIAPAAIRTMIGVTNSLGTLQTATKQEIEKVNPKSLFTPKLFKEANFWFTKDLEDKDVLETVRGIPSEQKSIKDDTDENKEQVVKTMEQQLILNLQSVEMKLEVGLGSVTKSVVAMCLSNINANVQNWSSELVVSSNINIEAALFNEHVLSWEPFIEPSIDSATNQRSPWSINCLITPSDDDDKKSIIHGLPHGNEADQKDGVNSLKFKQIIRVESDQYLNITITKTGLDLVQRLSALFNDVYNKRLPPTDDDELPMLSVWNATGRELIIEQLTGLQFVGDSTIKSQKLELNQSIPLKVPDEHHASGRLSVITDQSTRHHEEFALKTNGVTKIISISRTGRRFYEINASKDPNWPVQLLCDAQIKNNRRRIVLSSIIRLINNSTLPIVLLDDNPEKNKAVNRVAKIDVNQDFPLPIDLLYKNSESKLFFTIDENDSAKNFFAFDWKNQFDYDAHLKLNNGTNADFVVFKEVTEAYWENTDQLGNATFNLFILPALHLTNLLPVAVFCSIDKREPVECKTSQLQLITSGSKKSSMIFTIPSYDNSKWISERVNLEDEGKGDNNEHSVIFRKADKSSSSETLRMILRVDAYHASYRLSLYSPFWVLNRTDLKLEFQIESIRTTIDITDAPYLLCPGRIESEASKKGQIRIYSSLQNESIASWSEKFSLDVIKSTGMATCKVANDRTYMICVDIVTSSFGLTKLVTLSPAMVISNKSSFGIDLVEIVGVKEQDKWKSLNPEQLIPFWPHDIEHGLMRVRFSDNQVTSLPFDKRKKHRTLLRMDDEERPAIYVEVSATDFDGVRMIFTDYKIGDAPVLVVNSLKKDPISFCQVDTVKTQIVPPLNYVYFTWTDPLKKRELTISYGTENAKIEFNGDCGVFGKDGAQKVNYTVFMDGVQTVLLFSDDQKVIEAASGIPILSDAISQCLQMGIQDIGISIVNDVDREELLYISLNQSKVVWTERKRTRARPISNEYNEQLEEQYREHQREREIDPSNKQLLTKKYKSKDFQEIVFTDNYATIISNRNRSKTVKRQALAGLSIDYAWSASTSMIHIRLNRVQIDNQLDYTIFPVMLHPVIGKAAANEYIEKPFVELSVYQSKGAQSNVVQFKYFKLLIQEFAVKIDQGLIVALLAFLRAKDSSSAPTVNMDTDLEQINKSLVEIVKAQIDTPTGETEMIFDQIHLSPLKIHVSFSMHGAKPTEELLAEYPLVGFLLQTLNVAEVQDVILRLGYYERKSEKYTVTKITNEVSSHYQNQFLKQLHVLVFGLDVLGNPFGVIRGLAEGVESFFYEPYKGAIEGPMEFAEGVATGVRSLFGSAVGGAAGAVSKITGVLGKGLATLTFDEDYKESRIRRKEPGANVATEIASGGKNVVMGFVDGVTGVVTKPIAGAKKSGATGFLKGVGKGLVGLVTRPTGGIVDFASTSLDLVKRTTQQEEVVRRVRYPRHVGRDGLVRPYIAHEATGFFILNRLEDGKYRKSDIYVAHIICTENPYSWLMATNKRILFVREISFLGQYEVDWEIEYNELLRPPIVKQKTEQIEIITKNKVKSSILSQTITRTPSSIVEDIDDDPKKSGTLKSQRTYGKLIKYRSFAEAKYLVEKIADAIHSAGL